MNTGYIELAVFLIILTLCSVVLGKYIASVFEGKIAVKIKVLGWVEHIIYRCIGIDPEQEMSWYVYAINVMIFSVLGVVLLFVMQQVQGVLPLNPQHLDAVPWDLAFNTANSFVTNTNWQAYPGETTMSYFTQMLGLAVQNFLSAGVALSVLVALIRGFSRAEVKQIGNFWNDLVKSTLYILLPLSVVVATILMSQGVPQNFNKYTNVKLIEPQTITQTIANKAVTTTITKQTIPQGPVASQEAIKMIGTNGGAFFNVNSAHPYEDPTPFSNFLEMLSILLIPGALCFAFGRMIHDSKQGYAIYIVMSIIFVIFTVMVMWAELKGNPLFRTLNIDQALSHLQNGGNMEGKESRFGIFASGLFAAVTTSASCGAVNAMHDSFMPLGGFVPLFLMMLSEIIFGGVGSGLYGMLAFVIVAVFISGLMIGRTPEYLGKKIEGFDMKMIAIIILIIPVLVLFGTSISLLIAPGVAGITNPGAHGLSQVLYAFTSAANNNGSAFAGLNANTLYYNLTLGVVVFIGRFGIIIPILALAGSLASKKHIPITSGTMPTTGIIFMSILIGVIIIVGALTYVPALALGPIVEHLLLFK